MRSFLRGLVCGALAGALIGVAGAPHALALTVQRGWISGSAATASGGASVRVVPSAVRWVLAWPAARAVPAAARPVPGAAATRPVPTAAPVLYRLVVPGLARAIYQPAVPAVTQPTVPAQPTTPTASPQPAVPAVAQPAVPAVAQPAAPATPQPAVPANTQPATQPAAPVAPGAGLTADEQRMLELVNQARAAQGLPPLAVDMRLVETARLKSRDMVEKGYFGHVSPTYGTVADMWRRAGIAFAAGGENIAGAPTVEMAFQNLMNSPGHRANILNPAYTHIGIGVVDGGPYGKMITQQFIAAR